MSIGCSLCLLLLHNKLPQMQWLPIIYFDYKSQFEQGLVWTGCLYFRQNQLGGSSRAGGYTSKGDPLAYMVRWNRVLVPFHLSRVARAFSQQCGWVKTTNSPKEPSRSYTAVCNLALEITQCHFHHNYKPAKIQGEGTETPTSLWEECQSRVVRRTCGMRGIVAVIFGKYSLP